MANESQQDRSSSTQKTPDTSRMPTTSPLEVSVVRLRPREEETLGTKLPVRSHPDDAGLDLTASNFVNIHKWTSSRIPHNIAVAIPQGYFGLIIGRSSAMQNKGLIVLPGVIDPGFRGEVQTVVFNAYQRTIQVQPGERISQLLILPLHALRATMVPVPAPEPKAPPVDPVTLLPASDRGKTGFGSTGGYKTR
jgi:dUTP pyrophosphatase